MLRLNSNVNQLNCQIQGKTQTQTQTNNRFHPSINAIHNITTRNNNILLIYPMLPIFKRKKTLPKITNYKIS